MKKLLKTTLSLLLPLLSLPLTALGLSRVNASAESTEESRLFLPSLYEEHLPLEAPSDVATGERYLAVADENRIYLLDREKEEYTLYEHTTNVNELEFFGEDLFFLDQAMNLYRRPIDDLETSTTAVQHCISFAISNDVMYFTKKSGGKAQIYSAPLSNPAQETARSDEQIAETDPAICTNGSDLYYTLEGKNTHLYLLSDENFEVRLPEKTIGSIAMDHEYLYYTAAKDFYVYHLTALRQNDENALVFKAEGNYSSVNLAPDGFIYVVKDSSILRYDPTAHAFTDYEIGSSSTTPNRLNDAHDFTQAGNTLVVAETGRIKKIDAQMREVKNLPSITGNWIASDGTTALIANPTSAALYDLQTGETLGSYPNFSSHIVGVVNVFGKYYLATEDGFCTIDETSKAIVRSITAPKTPALLSSDLFGYIYVAYRDGQVFSYTEDEFLDPNTQKTAKDLLATIESDCTKLLVDFDRTIYTLKNGKILAYKDGQKQTISLAERLVYGQDDSTPVTSFAFGYETGTTYVLYDQNFLAQTNKLSLPTLHTIDVMDASENVFDNQTANFTLVKIEKDALFIHFDIESLQGATYFPYLTYDRVQEERIALKLGETERFNVVTVFDEKTHEYFTAIVEKTSCLQELTQTEYLTEAERFTESPYGYITSKLPLYKFPYLTDLLTIDDLERHAQVKVLGAIEDLDSTYYLVEYTDEDGNVLQGYVPQSYVSPFDGRYPEAEENVYGETTSDVDSVWRATFLLLGGLAIAILVDALILRKKKD